MVYNLVGFGGYVNLQIRRVGNLGGFGVNPKTQIRPDSPLRKYLLSTASSGETSTARHLPLRRRMQSQNQIASQTRPNMADSFWRQGAVNNNAELMECNCLFMVDFNL